MRISDSYTIVNFVPGLELYRVAMDVFMAYYWQGSTAIVAASGNNGDSGLFSIQNHFTV